MELTAKHGKWQELCKFMGNIGKSADEGTTSYFCSRSVPTFL